MEKLTEKLEALNQEVIQRIADLIETKGEESAHRNDIVLKIKDVEQMHDLDGGRWLTELTESELIDNRGYSYDLSVLGLEELCDVLDSFI